MGYCGSLSTDHPEYLVATRDDDLYLNLVDMDRQLKHEFTEPIVRTALEFIDTRIGSTDVLIHCNQGRSRSPALALLYLAKRDGAIIDTSYGDATAAFRERYPRFAPGRGVDAYLRAYWDAFQ